MIEINMKIDICESGTPTLGTLSMISLEVDFVNIYVFRYNKVHEPISFYRLSFSFHFQKVTFFLWLLTMMAMKLFNDSCEILSKFNITLFAYNNFARLKPKI